MTVFAICLSDSPRTYLRKRSSRFHTGSISLPMTPRPRKTFSCSDVYRLPNIRDAYSLASFSLLKTLARPRFGRMIHIVPRQKPRFNSTFVIGKRMSSSTSLPGISSVSSVARLRVSIYYFPLCEISELTTSLASSRIETGVIVKYTKNPTTVSK